MSNGIVFSPCHALIASFSLPWCSVLHCRSHGLIQCPAFGCHQDTRHELAKLRRYQEPDCQCRNCGQSFGQGDSELGWCHGNLQEPKEGWHSHELGLTKYGKE